MDFWYINDHCVIATAVFRSTVCKIFPLPAHQEELELVRGDGGGQRGALQQAVQLPERG